MFKQIPKEWHRARRDILIGAGLALCVFLALGITAVYAWLLSAGIKAEMVGML